jgi:hypothetical protein
VRQVFYYEREIFPFRHDKQLLGHDGRVYRDLRFSAMDGTGSEALPLYFAWICSQKLAG